MHQIQPVIGQWYVRQGNNQRFEVVSIDEDDDTIELQDEGGTLDEVDIDTWFATEIENTSPPVDFISSFDNVASPDEADGGDPVDPDANMGDSQPQRVASEEMLDDGDVMDDVGEHDEGMETPPPTREEHHRTH